MKTLVPFLSLYLYCTLSFSQLIVYESDSYYTFEYSGENIINKFENKDSCRLIMQTYNECNTSSNGVLIDLEKSNKWSTLIGQILQKGEDFKDSETGNNQTSYPMKFIDASDIINGLVFTVSPYSMIFSEEDDMIFIAGGKNGLAMMNVKVRISH